MNSPASEVIEALISRPPHWLLRSGTGLMAAAFLLLLGFAAFIRYPDVVKGEARITSAHPPVPIQGATGQIESLQVGEGDTVQAKQVLAMLSQDLPFVVVGLLQDWVSKAVKALSKGELPEEPPRPMTPLGQLQTPYAAVLHAWDALWLQQSHNLSAQDRATAQQHLQLLGQRSNRLQDGDSLLAEKLRIATALYRADSLLQSQGFGSWLEVQTGRERMLTAQAAYAAAQAEVWDREIEAAATLHGIQRLGIEQFRSDSDLESNLWRNLVALSAAIGQWEDRHLLRAPFAGTLTFDMPPAIGQFLAEGQTFGWLIPLDAGPRFARLRIPAAGAGAVEKGQQVLITLADFPKAEFGTLLGRVEHVSPMLIAGEYPVDVALPSRMETSRGTQIALRNEAIGQAEIITQQRSLLERIFSHVMVALRE